MVVIGFSYPGVSFLCGRQGSEQVVGRRGWYFGLSVDQAGVSQLTGKLRLMLLWTRSINMETLYPRSTYSP